MNMLKRSCTLLLSSALVLLAGCGGGDSSSPPTPVAPSIATPPQALKVSEGAVATFTVSASGSAPFSYQWRRGGAPIIAATSSSYSTPRATLTDSGTAYSVVVTNSAGATTSSTATLTVVAKQWQVPQPRFSNVNNDGPVRIALDSRGNGFAL